MEGKKFVIEGTDRLEGEIPIGGAKNSVLGLMAAGIMAKGVTTIKNTPLVSDVRKLSKIMEKLGTKVTYDGHILSMDNTSIDPDIPLGYDETKELRASYYLIGALLGRFHRASVSMPGGCNIGSRPINIHIEGFKKLGARISLENGNIIAEADRLEGTDIWMPIPSVGATINIMLAAVLAEGVTVIRNAAMEPYISDIAGILTGMGAQIEIRKNIITIRGVKELHETCHTVMPDMIEAGTYLTAGAMMGDITVTGVIPEHLDAITGILNRMGCQIHVGEDWVRVKKTGRLKSVGCLSTGYYPGFPTDMQPQIAAALGLSDGISLIREDIFENRFLYVDEFSRIGARMTTARNVNVISGIKKYKPAAMSATDLRAGAAMVLACLTCGGEVQNINYIDRGYESMETKLSGIGAKIKRVNAEIV